MIISVSICCKNGIIYLSRIHALFVMAKEFLGTRHNLSYTSCLITIILIIIITRIIVCNCGYIAIQDSVYIARPVKRVACILSYCTAADDRSKFYSCPCHRMIWHISNNSIFFFFSKRLMRFVVKQKSLFLRFRTSARSGWRFFRTLSFLGVKER